MDVLGEQLAATRAGAGTVTVIEAAPGLGKTRLLEESGQIAGRLSMGVEWGGGDRVRLAVQMAPLLKALFGGETPLLDRSHLASLRAVSDQPYWLFLELGELLEVRARSGSLLVCLDDMQWADSGGLSAVQGLTSQTVGSPIAWIVAPRRGEAGGDRGSWTRWRTKPSAYVVCTQDHTVNPELQRFAAKRLSSAARNQNPSRPGASSISMSNTFTTRTGCEALHASDESGSDM